MLKTVVKLFNYRMIFVPRHKGRKEKKIKDQLCIECCRPGQNKGKYLKNST